MASWGSWVALIGGIISVLATFSFADGLYFPLIGGIVAIVGAIGCMMS